MNDASRRSEEKNEKLPAESPNEYDGEYGKMMKQTNETILQSVGLHLQGMNTTIEK